MIKSSLGVYLQVKWFSIFLNVVISLDSLNPLQLLAEFRKYNFSNRFRLASVSVDDCVARFILESFNLSESLHHKDFLYKDCYIYRIVFFHHSISGCCDELEIFFLLHESNTARNSTV